MDIQYFLEERTEFIRYFYETASKPFLEIHRKIEAAEPPFDNPPHDEGDEPPFLEEYGDAADGLNMLGRTAISMLKQVTENYFDEWLARLGVSLDEKATTVFKKHGKFNGYVHLFEDILGAQWSVNGANLELLEQVFLARNAEQHETRITSRHAKHTKRDMERFGDTLRFVSGIERKHREKMNAGEEGFETPLPFWIGHIEVTKEDLIEATKELEKLVEFLEPSLNKLVYGSKSGFPVKEEAASSPD